MSPGTGVQCRKGDQWAFVRSALRHTLPALPEPHAPAPAPTPEPPHVTTAPRQRRRRTPGKTRRSKLDPAPPADSEALPTDIISHICDTLRDQRSYGTLASMMACSLEVYVIAGPRLYERLTLDARSARVILGPAGLIKDKYGYTHGRAGYNHGLAAAWAELSLTVNTNKELPPLLASEWTDHPEYRLNPPAQRVRDTARRRLALLARTKSLRWNVLPTSNALEPLHSNAISLPLFRSVTRLSLAYSAFHSFLDRPYMPITTDDHRALVRYGVRPTHLCIEAEPVAWLDEDQDPLHLADAFPRRVKDCTTGSLAWPLSSISIHRLGSDLGSTLVPGIETRYYLPTSSIKASSGWYQDKLCTARQVERVLSVLRHPNFKHASKVTFVDAGWVKVDRKGTFEERFNAVFQQRVMDEVQRTLDNEGNGEIWERSLKMVTWTNSLDSPCFCAALRTADC